MCGPCLPFKIMLLKNLSLLTITIVISIRMNAQQLELTSLKRIDPSTIISSNYKSILECRMSKYKIFDNNNPYTYVQLMVDENGKIYQILYQTDIADKLVYLSISNNFKCDCFEVNKNEFCNCVKKSHEESISSLQTSYILDCAFRILRRCDL